MYYLHMTSEEIRKHLNDEQQNAIDIAISGENMFLTGGPGTGKSYTLRTLIKILHNQDKNFVVTAPTGCAASNINGRTLHSVFGLKRNPVKVEDAQAHFSKLKAPFKKFIKSLQILIIDEISMVDNILFDFVSVLLQLIKDNKLAFGGIQVIVVGDFFQLPPVENVMCFKALSWKLSEFHYIHLNESMRQKDDMDFIKILNKLRYGNITKKTYLKLKELQNKSFDESRIKPTKLFSTNRDVDRINNEELNKLLKNGSQEYSYEATYDTNIPDDIKKYVDRNVKLCEDAQIMVTQNMPEQNLVNGTRGYVLTLDNESVDIMTISGEVHTISFFDATYTKREVMPDKSIHETEYIYRYMPLRLAYAITIHKSQGMTIDCMEIDLSKIFAYGQGYTGLSRAKSLEHTRIVNIQGNPFKCDPEVIEFYENISS